MPFPLSLCPLCLPQLPFYSPHPVLVSCPLSSLLYLLSRLLPPISSHLIDIRYKELLWQQGWERGWASGHKLISYNQSEDPLTLHILYARIEGEGQGGGVYCVRVFLERV